MIKSILLITTLCVLFTQIFGQTTKEVELTYQHKTSFQKLFKAGDKQRFVQLCNSQMDSVVQGTINFKIASVGTIMNCKMAMRILTDTIRNYRIETSDLENTRKLIDETMVVYGKPTETKTENGKQIYVWKNAFMNNLSIVSTLTIRKKNKKGLLVSAIQ